MDAEIRDRLDRLVEEGILRPNFGNSFLELYGCYREGAGAERAERHFSQYLDLMERQLRNPFPFPAIHWRCSEPVDYFQFGLRQAEMMVDRQRSTVMAPTLSQIESQLEAGENVVLLSNHQTELDCHLVSLLLGDDHRELTSRLMWVAGDRVVNDPMAVPLSLGLNLICIYSKKHINHPPEMREEKLTHNRRAMRQVRELLSEGGQAIVLFPSGGRDRPNQKGEIIPSPFDPAAIELFRLVAERSGRPTHFYPMALNTYAFMPPPPEIGQELGESRICQRVGVGIAIGERIDFEGFDGPEEKQARREAVAEQIWSLVCQDYRNIKEQK